MRIRANIGLAHGKHPVFHSYHYHHSQEMRRHKAQPPQTEGSTTLQQAARPTMGWGPREEAPGHWQDRPPCGQAPKDPHWRALLLCLWPASKEGEPPREAALGARARAASAVCSKNTCGAVSPTQRDLQPLPQTAVSLVWWLRKDRA